MRWTYECLHIYIFIYIYVCMCVCGGLWVCNFHCVKYGCDFLGPSYLYPVFFSYRDAALRLAWVQEWTFRWWFSERGWCRSIPDVLGLQVMETRKYASEKSGRTNVVIHGLPAVFWWILIHVFSASSYAASIAGVLCHPSWLSFAFWCQAWKTICASFALLG